METVFKAVNPVIPVRDMADALGFYEGKLGFTRVFDHAETPNASN